MFIVFQILDVDMSEVAEALSLASIKQVVFEVQYPLYRLFDKDMGLPDIEENTLTC